MTKILAKATLSLKAVIISNAQSWPIKDQKKDEVEGIPIQEEPK